MGLVGVREWGRGAGGGGVEWSSCRFVEVGGGVGVAETPKDMRYNIDSVIL